MKTFLLIIVLIAIAVAGAWLTVHCRIDERQHK